MATLTATTTPSEKSPSVATEPDKVEEVSAASLEDVDLTGAPALRPPKTLRIHERAAALAECIRLAKQFEDREVNAEGGTSELDPEILTLFGEVDLVMEKHVVDAGAYIAWSTELDGMDGFLRVMALFAKYTERLGG